MPPRVSPSSLAGLANDSPVLICLFDYLEKAGRYQHQKPYYFSGLLNPEEEQSRTNLTYTAHDGIDVRDIRAQAHNLDLERHGFQLLTHTAMTDLTDPDEEEIKDYLEEISSFIKDKLNAELVLAYNYRFRKETKKPIEDPKDAVGTHKNQDKPVLTPHTDQTRTGRLRRTRHHMSDEEAEKYLDGNYRIRILNCWRPLYSLANKRPLTFCDFYTVADSDLRAADRASREYVGEIYHMQYNENQK